MNFRALENSIWVLEKSWKFVSEKGYKPCIKVLLYYFNLYIIFSFVRISLKDRRLDSYLHLHTRQLQKHERTGKEYGCFPLILFQ